MPPTPSDPKFDSDQQTSAELFEAPKRELDELECLYLEPTNTEEELRDQDLVDATCVWLHGLGADGHDLSTLPEYLELPKHIRVKHILPHAPVRKVTVNGGIAMRAWYDMMATPPRFNDKAEDIADSVEQVANILRKEKQSTKYVIGFSQGGCIALHLAMKYGELISGGVIALSCYVPNPDDFANISPGYITPPIFLGHGKHDPVIPFGELQKSAHLIRPFCVDLVVRRYRGGHSIESDTIRDINYWFQNRI